MVKRILFVNAINPTNPIETAYPSLGIGYLISALREHFGPDYFEFKVVNRNYEEAVKEFCPDVVGITAVSQNYNRAIAAAAIAKAAGAFVIMGGMHLTALPQSMTEDMNMAVIGEGE